MIPPNPDSTYELSLAALDRTRSQLSAAAAILDYPNVDVAERRAIKSTGREDREETSQKIVMDRRVGTGASVREVGRSDYSDRTSAMALSG
jgi:hypothetical protein